MPKTNNKITVARNQYAEKREEKTTKKWLRRKVKLAAKMQIVVAEYFQSQILCRKFASLSVNCPKWPPNCESQFVIFEHSFFNY